MVASQREPIAGVQVDGLRARSVASGPGVSKIGSRHVELADVVHERAPVDLADLGLREPGELRDAHRQRGDPAGVRERVRAPALELGDDERGLDLAVTVEASVPRTSLTLVLRR